jgi:hypothetical protein
VQYPAHSEPRTIDSNTDRIDNAKLTEPNPILPITLQAPVTTIVKVLKTLRPTQLKRAMEQQGTEHPNYAHGIKPSRLGRI